MSEKSNFNLSNYKGKDRFARRLAKTTGRMAVFESRKNDARTEALEKMRDMISLLDMSLEGQGVERIKALMLAPPMIYSKPTSEARDPVDVAFGDKDFAGKNFIEINPTAVLTKEDVKQVQSIFPEGVTLIGNQENIQVRPAEYDELLTANDAVVITRALAHASYGQAHQNAA